MGQSLGKRLKISGGVLSLAGSLYLGLSVYTYSKWDPSFFTYTPDPVKNKGGVAGAYLADFFMALMGAASYSVPFFLAVYGLKGVLVRERHKINLAGAGLFIVSASALSYLVGSSFGLDIEPGMLGRALGGASSSLLSTPGAYILSLAIFITSLILLSPAPFIYYLLRSGEKKTAPEQKPGQIVVPTKSYEPDEEGLIMSSSGYLTDENVPEVFAGPLDAEPPDEEAPDAESELEALTKGLYENEDMDTKGPLGRAEDPLLISEKPPETLIEAPQETTIEEALTNAGGYCLPGIDLLMLHEQDGPKAQKDASPSDTSSLEKRLADFGVQGRITQVHVGPIVTMYEFEPAPGVKINRVVSLSDDIALGLKAKSVRISPIPGKSTLGLEVPNRDRESVSLREIISSDGFKKSSSKLTMALGKDIFGNPVVADLTKMPHLLVAGSTGSGKSVALNSMVVSVLYKAAPEDVKMLLIDPKLLELSVYEGIPHLISPVITSPKEASGALKKIVFEMDRRYRLLAERGARNIDGFNASVPAEEKMPYIVVVIDELADLMFTSASEVEDSIARLAQMARASGIHLILATQRPSVDVITGVIKANFPARISFQVTSKIDSRTILDSQGAEQLIGKGDMLFMLPGSRTMRIHGALVTEPEINAVTGFVKAQGSPDYAMLESIPAEEEQKGPSEDERDDLYYRAVEHAESTGEVSISSIQRRLKIGYNRAARIMELMEDDGLVGPPKGAGKPRDFLRRG